MFVVGVLVGAELLCCLCFRLYVVCIVVRCAVCVVVLCSCCWVVCCVWFDVCVLCGCGVLVCVVWWCGCVCVVVC